MRKSWLNLPPGQSFEEYVSNLQVQVDELGATIGQLEKQKVDAVALVQRYELENLYRSAAINAGLNQDALLSLVNAGLLPDLKVQDGVVTVSNQRIDDYLAQPGRQWLKNALVPIVEGSEQLVALPSGGAVSATPVSSVNPVEDVFQSIGVFIPGANS